MTTVAKSTALNDAIAQMSERAWGLLRDVHAGRRSDARAMAVMHLRELNEIARCTGIELNDVPAYRTHSAHWSAIARLAGEPLLAGEPALPGAEVSTQETTQAG